jgi:aryl-alcohol dehydrogenase-like predicted oxidoreductase
MNYRTLGRTGLVVSEIGFGAWGIGGRTAGHTSYGETDDAQSLTALQRALDRGITFFDTSSAYGNGHSEELIGRAFAKSRHSAIIATKAGYDSWDRPPDFSAAAIVASAERSLTRLRSDYIDVFQLHNAPRDALRSDELQEALSRLTLGGKIRTWGVSTKSPAEAEETIRLWKAPIVQANFNMMDVRALTCGLFDDVVHHQVGFIARTPLCFGFLTGLIRRDTIFPPGDHRLGWPRAQLDNWIDGAADLLAAVSAVPGRSAVHSALRFCLSFAAVSSVIPGILTSKEVDDNADASSLGALPSTAVEAVLAINRGREFIVSPARVA